MDLNSLTKTELLAKCEELGIKKCKSKNKNELIEFNQKGLTIIVPHEEGDFFNTNYNPIVAFDLGCQFVAMEFQYIDINMDYYITKFKNASLVMKSDELRKNKKLKK